MIQSDLATDEQTSESRLVRVACWPFTGGNPYQSLLARALGERDIVVENPPFINDDWLRAAAPQIDAIHIHWPESLWRTRGRTWLGRLRGVLGVDRFLALARSLDVRILWTVHNLENHEGSTWVDRMGYRTLAKHADALVCHDENAARAIRDRYPAVREVLIVPHGNYAGWYPEPRSREQTLSELGFDPARPVLGLLGLIRSYKGIEFTLDAMDLLPPDVQLLIAGGVHPDYDIEALRRRVARRPQVRLCEGFLDDQAFANYMHAIDALLLPYRRVTGSGAMLAGLTFGRPTIASDLPFFRSLAQLEPPACELFDSTSAASLAQAIERLTASPLDPRRRAARRLADRYAWTQVIEPLVDFLHQNTSSK